MKSEQAFITKASGEKELFSSEKLKRSLSNAGTRSELVDDMVSYIERGLREGMTTDEIHKSALMLLNERAELVAVKYNLRKAVMQLGPDGFPFERLVGEILKSQGYKVKIGQMLQGECIEHEVDVLAEKDHKHIFVEAKFHNKQGIKTDLKTTLYVQSRFEDIVNARENHTRKFAQQPKIHKGWLITNTKLTAKAKEYGRCKGLVLIGWNYPQKGNLQDLITKAGIHPLTCLSLINYKQKKELLNAGALLCRDLRNKHGFLSNIGFDKNKIDRVMREIDYVCGLTV